MVELFHIVHPLSELRVNSVGGGCWWKGCDETPGGGGRLDFDSLFCCQSKLVSDRVSESGSECIVFMKETLESISL